MLAVLLASIVLWALLAWEGRGARWPRRLLPLATGLFVAIGIAHAWSMRWLADDAFISFRYARNWAAGLGPVFNPGEWVEGYTNFLWMALLALGSKLGLSIPHLAFFGNLACLGIAIAGAAWIVARLHPGTAVPLAALALAGCSAFVAFGTSGLETMVVAALVVAGMAASVATRRTVVAGLAFALAVLCRPDAILLWAAFGLALVGEDLIAVGPGEGRGKLQLRRYLAYAGPVILLYPAYFLWRWMTYGSFVPHTFAVKVPGAYWEQGTFYVAHAVLTSGGWAWLPALGLALTTKPRGRPEVRLRLSATIGLPLFALYLAYVGGDFMEYRFFVPLFPIAFIVAELGLRRAGESWVGPKRWLARAIAAIAFAAAVVPIRLIGPWEFRWHLAAEHSFYRVTSLFPLEIDSLFWRRGKALAAFVDEVGVAPRIATGGVGMVGYLSDLPIVDAFGLVNEAVGRRPIERRGRPGHERVADVDTLIDEGAILTTDVYWSADVIQLSMGVFDEYALLFLQYDRELIEALSRRGAKLLPIPEEDIPLVLSQDLPLDVLEEIHAFYARFLRRHPRREALLAQIEAAIVEARSP